jgi:hypothetical protein
VLFFAPKNSFKLQASSFKQIQAESRKQKGKGQNRFNSNVLYQLYQPYQPPPFASMLHLNPWLTGQLVNWSTFINFLLPCCSPAFTNP